MQIALLFACFQSDFTENNDTFFNKEHAMQIACKLRSAVNTGKIVSVKTMYCDQIDHLK